MKPIVIAVAGKGGTGKTTTCGLIIQHLADTGKGPILAVDADPNSNLNEVLGVDVELTLGEIREKLQFQDSFADELPPNMTKQEYTEFMFGDALIEGDDYDLLVMGRTQGAGCYCYINGVLKAQIDKYQSGYRFLVVDNEAGLEHISRGLLPRIDILLLVSDASRRGVQAAGRAAEMVLAEIEKQGLDLLGVLPQDETIYQYDAAGRPSSTVPKDNPVRKALSDILAKIDL
jgi:CO dehydrogenase maturation factor